MEVVSHKVETRPGIRHGAAGTVLEPGGRRAFVACSPNDYVSVIDLRARSVVGKIDTGGEPEGMAWGRR